MKFKISRARKALVPLVTGLIGWATVVVDSAQQSITAPEWIALSIIGASGLGVYAVPNEK